MKIDPLKHYYKRDMKSFLNPQSFFISNESKFAKGEKAYTISFFYSIFIQQSLLMIIH